MDIFLLAGIKGLYMFAIGFFQYYKHLIKNNRFATGQEFWKYVRSMKDKLNNHNEFMVIYNSLFHIPTSHIPNTRGIPSRKIIHDMEISVKSEIGMVYV
jgi:hypothetical protein